MRADVRRYNPCVPRHEPTFPAKVVMSYVGDKDAFDDAADTWTPAAITAKPSMTRTSGTIDFIEIPPRPPPATPNSTLTLLQTENVTREPLGKRSSALSNSIMNSFIRCLVPAKRASVLQANDVGMSARPTRLYTRAMMCFPRGLEMPNYITLGNWTEQGIKNVKESPKRADAVAALANKLGAKMQIFYTMGRYDIVVWRFRQGHDVVSPHRVENLHLGTELV